MRNRHSHETTWSYFFLVTTEMNPIVMAPVVVCQMPNMTAPTTSSMTSLTTSHNTSSCDDDIYVSSMDGVWDFALGAVVGVISE